MEPKRTPIEPFGLLLEPSRPGGDIRDLDVDLLRELVWRERLIVLRGFRNFTSPEDFSEYCERWGEISVWPFGKVLELVERNNPEDHIFDNNYVPLHWDGMYRPQVPEFQLFHCVRAPRASQGGRTTFSNTVLALENAPARPRALWEKVTGHYQRKMEFYDSKTVSPVVDTHPLRGFSVIRYNEPPREGYGQFVNPPILEFSGVDHEELAEFHRYRRISWRPRERFFRLQKDSLDGVKLGVSMKRLLFLAAGMFALGCDDYVFAGLLPRISASLHTTIALTAQGFTAFGIAYVVSAPICAFLLARKPVRHVLTTALVVFIAGNVTTLLSTGLIFYLTSRCIAGLGAGLFLPVAVAAGTQLVEPSSRGRALSVIWGSNSAGAVLGVPLGLWLANKVSWRATIILILILTSITLMGTVIGQLALRVDNPPSIRDQFRLLVDRRVLAVISVTLLTATGSLGLYAYTAPMLSGTVLSPEVALSFWNIGGLIGSVAIGYVVDRAGKSQLVMAMILAALSLTITAIPTLRSVPVLGFLPFLLWGALSWSTVTPQQHSLIELQPKHDAILVALNSSAVSLGSVAGAALGGLALAGDLSSKNLPYAASIFLLCALAWQMLLIQKRQHKEVSVTS